MKHQKTKLETSLKKFQRKSDPDAPFTTEERTIGGKTVLVKVYAAELSPMPLMHVKGSSYHFSKEN